MFRKFEIITIQWIALFISPTIEPCTVIVMHNNVQHNIKNIELDDSQHSSKNCDLFDPFPGEDGKDSGVPMKHRALYTVCAILQLFVFLAGSTKVEHELGG